MKHILLAILVVFMIGCGSDRARVARLTAVLDSVKTEYAPDPRTAVFSVVAEIDDDTLVIKGEVDNPGAKRELFARLRDAGEPDFIDSVRLLPDTSLGGKIYGIVNVSVGNLYAAPKDQSELVDQVLLGHTLKILKKHRGWFYVQSAPEPPFDKGYLGWMSTGNVFRIDSSELSAYDSVRKLIVTSVSSIVRSAPRGGTTVTDLVIADFLEPVSSSGGCFKVELPGRRSGYVDRGDVQYYDTYLSMHKPTAAGIEKCAKEFLGFPYLWGGTSSKAMDCSGFVKTVFRMNGINLPRDASQQCEIGDSIDPGQDFANLRPADLLFFGEKATQSKPKRIVHVGIYLGKGYFIHSSNMVRVSSLNKNDSLFDEFDFKRFVEARRILVDGTKPVGHE